MDMFFASSSLLGIVLRATVLLVAAVALTRALRRTAAETRHLLWTTTFVLLLGLPLAMAWMPAWELEILPMTPIHRESPVSSQNEGVDAASRPGVVAEPTIMEADGGFITPPGVSESTPSIESKGRLSLWDRIDMQTVLVWLWAVGCMASLLSLIIGTLRFQLMVRKAIPVDDIIWRGQVRGLSKKLGISRQVRLLISSKAATPMTSGWWRPVIVLPISAATWSEERLEVVLMHELIHIRRHDALRQLMGHATLSLYWFHPLSWIAARLSTMSREQACDEAVLALGTRPSAYATHLLDLADGMQAAPLVVSLPMIQKSQLEKRLMAILQPNRPHRNTFVNILAPLLIGILGLTAAIARPVETVTEVSSIKPTEAPGDVSNNEGLLFVESEASTETIKPMLPPVTDQPAQQLIQLAAVDDPTCQTDRFRGNFSGTFTSRSDDGRREFSGWNNGDRIIQQYDGDLRLCMRLHGEVVMAADGKSVRAVGADSWVVLESEDDKLHRLVITEGANGIEYAWSIDEQSASFDEDARMWRDRMFTVMNGFWEAGRIRGEESRLRGQISSHRGHISSLRGQISSHKGRVSSLRGQISSRKGHVSSLRGQISSHKGRVSSLRGQISSHRGHVSSLRGQISSLRGRMSGMNSLDGVLDEDDLQNLNQMKAKVEDRIREIEQEIEDYDLEGKERELEKQIADYNLDARIQGIEAEIADYDVDDQVRDLGSRDCRL